MYDPHDAIINEFFKLEPWFSDQPRTKRLLKRAEKLLGKRRVLLAELRTNGGSQYDIEGAHGDVLNLEEMTEVLTRVSVQTARES